MGNKSFLLCLFLLSASTELCLESCTNKKSMHAQESEKVRILALGDSYTIGESVQPAGRWVMQLAEALRNSGREVEEPNIIASTGWTTTDLQSAINTQKPDSNYDLVFLLIGVNNQYQGKSSAAYRAEFSALLSQAIAFARGKKERVFVLSIPDWGITPFAAGRDREKVSGEIDLFNTINTEESAKTGVHYADITPQSRLAKNDAALLAADGLHPSELMYKGWMELLLPNVKQALNAK
jgi:lysophospholipase L1-like esterase